MANVKATRSKQLFTAQKAPGISSQALDMNSLKTHTAMLRGIGACTAVVVMEGSALPDDDSFAPIITLNISTADAATSPGKEYGVTNSPWPYVRFTLVSISGTNAAVDAAVGA